MRALILLLALGLPGLPGAAEFEVTDVFGRRLNERGIVLVDWDGYMANPAIRLCVRAKAIDSSPVRAMVTANHPRLYFNLDLPSATTPDGPRGELDLNSSTNGMFLSIFPDRDGADERHELQIAGGGTVSRIPIHVLDQDRPHSNRFQIKVDFSQDKTGFFDDGGRRAFVQQAADDWAFFFDDMKLERTRAGAEKTLIWPPDAFANGKLVGNSEAYTGFLLYAYGFHSSALRSGGEGSYAGGLQTSNGVPLTIKRSGGFEAETAGNYNSLGWLMITNDNQWARTGNLRHETNDFYSIAHHEIGHALIFNPAHPGFARVKEAGEIRTAEILKYQGAPVRIDKSDHLQGATDAASLRGAFGNDYGGNIPRKRWMTTKLDLLCAKAVGYAIRPTSAFRPLQIDSSGFNSKAAVDQPFKGGLRASGGIPDYFFAVRHGTLPPGLAIDSFTGAISGTPQNAGDFKFAVEARDNTANASAVTISLEMTVAR